MKNALREHLRLSVIEVKRLVVRKQILLAVAVVLLLVYHDLFHWLPKGYPPALFGVGATSETDGILNSFIAAAGAAALAVDTETGFLGLALSRNVRRWHHILHKVVAMWVVITGLTVFRYFLLYVVGAFFLAWDVPHLGECQQHGLDHQGLFTCLIAAPTTLRHALGPFPALFMTHPVLNDLVGVAMVAVGTSVMALLGLFAAACGANGFVAMSMPVVVVFAIRFTLENVIPYWANPTNLVGVFGATDGFPAARAERIWAWFPAAFAWTVGLTLLTMFIAEKRELAMKGDTT